MAPTRRSETGFETAIPGVYFTQRFPDALGAGTIPQITVVLGTSGGGVPWNAADVPENERVIRITDSVRARNLLRYGPGFYGCHFYLTPHAERNLSSPSEVGFLMINDAARSESTVQSSLAADVIDLKSSRFGNTANQIARRIQTGTNVGYYPAIKFGSITYQQDDVSLSMFEIQYTGTGTAAALTITATTLTTSVAGGPGGEDLSLTLSEFENLSELVERINSESSYTCYLRASSSEDPTIFDEISGQDILTSPVVIRADVEAVIRWINSSSGDEVIAELSAGAARTNLATDPGFVFFTGASDGAATFDDWNGALELLFNDERIRGILLMTGDQSVQTLLRDHLREAAKEQNMRHRQGGTGAALALTGGQARRNQARDMNEPGLEYHVTPFWRADPLNRNARTKFDPFYAAACSMGTRHGNKVTTSAEGKYMNALGVAETYDRGELEEYARAGCSVLVPDASGRATFKINVTTDQSGNTILSLPSAVRTCHEITLDMKSQIQRRVNQLDEAGTELVINEFEAWILGNLLPSYVTRGFLTKDVATERAAISDFKFDVSGDVWTVSFTAVVAVPPRFIFGTHTFVAVGQL